MTAAQLLKLAGEHQLAGNLREARLLCQHALEMEPENAGAIFRLGLMEAQENRLQPALELIERAVAISPGTTRHFFGLGQVLGRLGRYQDAAAAFRKVVDAEPQLADAHYALGTVLQLHGDLPTAERAYRAAVRHRPEFAEAWVNLGVVLCDLRRFAEAAAALQQAVKLNPAIPEAAYNLGNALLRLGRPLEAAIQYRNAVALKADYVDAYNNLGNACKEFGDFPASVAAFEAAIKHNPGFTAAFNNLGAVYRLQGRMEEAEEVLRRALAVHPEDPVTLNNLGNALKDGGELTEAITCFRRAVSLDSHDAIAHSNLVYSLTFQATDGRTILEECRRWDAWHGRLLRPSPGTHDNDRSPERRLRVGYVSGDFRNHCQSLFTLPLFTHHDHGKLEIFCYSSVERPDDYTHRIERHADVWRSVRPLNDGELGEVIRRDRIDILVDLEMHMSNGRPQLFARKPAPVQVAWLAYPGTTGISAIDYAFTDPRLVSPDCDHEYSERVLRLPDTFWCYDPLASEPAVNELPALTAGHVTLACLNAPCKISDQTIRMWGGVMRAVENSRLLIMVPPGSHRRHLLDSLAGQGIAGERVAIQPFQRRADYLRTYHQIDLALDTFPYNGHTTSLDSFWMGVPVVSRVGRTAVGRAGLSQLFNLGLGELAAETDERYVEIAAALAADRPRLAALRKELRGRMERSPLMDARRFAKNIETAYREIWREWCRGGASIEKS